MKGHNGMKKGLFISVEGIEGAGKSTALESVKESLGNAGTQHIQTHEPGGTPFADEIRALLLKPRDEIVVNESELLLMYASRVQHVEKLIKPNLAKGIHVVTDRFNDSTFAYQGGGRQIDIELIRQLDEWCLKGFKPDLTILLDLPVDVGLDRATKRGEKDRIEVEKVEFFEDVRTAYLALAKDEPKRFAIIDATQPPEQVKLDVLATINTLLNKF
jgi:dTMP kinase